MEKPAIDKVVTRHARLDKDAKIKMTSESRIDYYQQLISDIVANVLGYKPDATQVVNVFSCKASVRNLRHAYMDMSHLWSHYKLATFKYTQLSVLM